MEVERLTNQFGSRSLTDKCIVLDIDETLVHTSTNFNAYSSYDKYKYADRIFKYTIDGFNYWSIKRPYLSMFLNFCFDYFKIVGIWSLGEERYVNKIVEVITKDTRTPHVVFSRNDAEGMTKPLVKLYGKFPGIMKETNTFVVDNIRSTMVANPKNGILF